MIRADSGATGGAGHEVTRFGPCLPRQIGLVTQTRAFVLLAAVPRHTGRPRQVCRCWWTAGGLPSQKTRSSTASKQATRAGDIGAVGSIQMDGSVQGRSRIRRHTETAPTIREAHCAFRLKVHFEEDRAAIEVASSTAAGLQSHSAAVF